LNLERAVGFNRFSFTFVANGIQKLYSLIKNQHHVLAKVFSFSLLMLTYWNFSYGQTPAVRIETNEIDHPTNQKDWIFSVIEDAENNLVSAGYSGPNFPTYPSLVKTNGHLEKIWSIRCTAGYDDPLTSTSPNVFGGYGQFQDVLEYTDPDDSKRYYVATGYATVDSKICLLLIKTELDGTILTGFPKIYRNDITTYNASYTAERRGRSIIYDNDGDGYFYIAGSDAYGTNGPKACVFRLDEDLSIQSLAQYFPTSPQSYGDLYSLCFEYPTGSLPDGKPENNTETPDFIWATGMAFSKVALNPLTPLILTNADSNIIITKIPIDFFSASNTVIESSGSAPSPVWDNAGGGAWGNSSGVHTNWYNHFKNQAPLCGAKFHNRTSGDMGMSIRQLNDAADGNIVVAGLCNMIMYYEYNTSCISNFNTARGSDVPYWTDADISATVIERNNFPTLGLPPTGYEKEARHLGHASGFESFIKVRQDYDNNLYFTCSNGDSLVAPLKSNGRTLLTSFFVIKTEPDLTPIWEKAYPGGDDDIETCGFGAMVCENNELVVAGDNKNNSDNYDLVRLSTDCEENYQGYTMDGTGLSFGADGITVSITSPVTLTGNEIELKGRIVIENGGILTLNTTTIEFVNLDHLIDKAYNNGLPYGIEVGPGGKLILINSVLTSLDHCNSFWRGVHLQAVTSADQTDPGDIGILEMTDSRIENAVCGVTVDGGGLITCTTSEFLNNRKGVAFMPFNDDNLSRFNFVDFNFVNTNDISDFYGIGLNTHCSMYGTEKVIFNGCTFNNTYTGPYRVGYGLASFDATFQVLRGNSLIIPQTCGPLGTNSTFGNLAIGIASDRTPSSPGVNFIGVAECEFTNCGTGWLCDDDVAPLAYKNTFDWDDDLADYPMPDDALGKGFSSNNTDDIKLYENLFTSSESEPTVFGVVINNTAGFAYKSHVKNNDFTENSGGNTFYYGVKTSGDNGLFELECNNFYDISHFDWHNTGNMQAQGDGSIAASNLHSTGGSPLINIHSNTSFLYSWAVSDPSLSGSVTKLEQGAYDACTVLDPCDVYDNIGIVTDIFELNVIAAVLPSTEELIWDNIKAKNYIEAKALTNQLADEDYKQFLNVVIKILGEHRETKPTNEEIETLKTIALANNKASINAKHFLSFFLEIPIKDNNTLPLVVEKQITNMVINSNNNNENAFKVYPNPTNGILNFEWNIPNGKAVTLTISEINGKTVAEYTHLNAQLKKAIDFKPQANGIYIYKIYNKDGYFKTGKVVLTK
jgi:hypothetical protein